VVFVQRHAVLVEEELLIGHQFQQVLPVMVGQAPQDKPGSLDGQWDLFPDLAAVVRHNETLRAIGTGLGKPGALLRKRNRLAAIRAGEIYETLFGDHIASAYTGSPQEPGAACACCLTPSSG
jgi:hypothetical protein